MKHYPWHRTHLPCLRWCTFPKGLCPLALVYLSDSPLHPSLFPTIPSGVYLAGLHEFRWPTKVNEREMSCWYLPCADKKKATLVIDGETIRGCSHHVVNTSCWWAGDTGNPEVIWWSHVTRDYVHGCLLQSECYIKTNAVKQGTILLK